MILLFIEEHWKKNKKRIFLLRSLMNSPHLVFESVCVVFAFVSVVFAKLWSFAAENKKEPAAGRSQGNEGFAFDGCVGWIPNKWKIGGNFGTKQTSGRFSNCQLALVTLSWFCRTLPAPHLTFALDILRYDPRESLLSNNHLFGWILSRPGLDGVSTYSDPWWIYESKAQAVTC